MTAQTIDALCDLLVGGEPPLRFLVSYGSLLAESDIDLLGVFEWQPIHTDYAIGRLDLLAFSCVQFEYLLTVHDPVISEPLLTGTLEQGDCADWSDVRSEFVDSRPSQSSVLHLYQRAFQILSSARASMDSFIRTKAPFAAFSFWRNIPFAVSYGAFAIEYARGGSPQTLGDLLPQFPELKDTIAASKDSQDSESVTVVADMKKYHAIACSMLLAHFG